MPLLLVMLGGALGTAARFLVGRSVPLPASGFPVATLTVNIVGGLLMGLLAGILARTNAGEGWRLFAGVGVLGGFTTFSAFSLDAVTLVERGQPLLATGYVAASVVGAIGALVAGLVLVRAAT